MLFLREYTMLDYVILLVGGIGSAGITEARGEALRRRRHRWIDLNCHMVQVLKLILGQWLHMWNIPELLIFLLLR